VKQNYNNLKKSVEALERIITARRGKQEEKIRRQGTGPARSGTGTGIARVDRRTRAAGSWPPAAGRAAASGSGPSPAGTTPRSPPESRAGGRDTRERGRLPLRLEPRIAPRHERLLPGDPGGRPASRGSGQHRGRVQMPQDRAGMRADFPRRRTAEGLTHPHFLPRLPERQLHGTGARGRGQHRRRSAVGARPEVCRRSRPPGPTGWWPGRRCRCLRSRPGRRPPLRGAEDGARPKTERGQEIRRDRPVPRRRRDAPFAPAGDWPGPAGGRAGVTRGNVGEARRGRQQDRRTITWIVPVRGTGSRGRRGTGYGGDARGVS
jgi:hypothetical protein